MKRKIPFDSAVTTNDWKENTRYFKSVVHYGLNMEERIAWSESPGMDDLMLSGCGHYIHAAGHRWKRKGLDEGVYIYCVKGRGYYRRGSKEYEITPGELLYCPPRTHHEYWADSENPWTIYWIHIFGNRLASIAAQIGFNDSVPILQIGVNSEIEDSFHELLDAIKNVNQATYRFFIQSCIYHTLGLFAVNAHLQQPQNRLPDEITAAIKYMEESLDKQLTIDGIADFAGISPFHFCRLFKKYTGATIINYFNRLKIHKACAMIAGSNLKIKEIANDLGYNDPYYFSRVFKKITGYSPEYYRKAQLT